MNDSLITQRGIIGAANIDAAKEHFALFNQVKREVMKPEVHFGLIPGVKKPTLFQPGAQVLLKLFNLTHEIQETHRTVDPLTGFVCYEYKVVISRDGFPVAEGVGACNSFEDKYAFTAWARADKPDNDTQVKMKAANLGKNYKDGPNWVWMQRERKPAPDLIALQNTVMKMAQKRATVAATLNATGGGEFFSQDIEDMPEVKEIGETVAMYEGFILAQIKAAPFVEDLHAIWKALPQLQKSAWFVDAVKEKNRELNPA